LRSRESNLQREEVRATLKENREAFLDRRREAREDFRKRLVELKDKLQDRREAIEEAKRDNPRRRAGN
jgi:hypothetical protein